MKLHAMSLDYETNMALLSYLSGSQLKKQMVHECDGKRNFNSPSSSQKLNLEECNRKSLS